MTQDDRFQLRHFIVTVDALNLHRDFADGQRLSADSLASADPALRHAAKVLAEQIAFASVIILTKIDTIPKEVAEAQVRNLQKIQPRAAVGLSAARSQAAPPPMERPKGTTLPASTSGRRVMVS